MRAITFDVSPARFVIGRTLGRLTPSALYGALSAIRLRDLPAPTLPGERWVGLKVRLAGICGTDLGNLKFASSPALEPFASFPAVPGHEILAEVTEVGSGVTRVRPGDRVVVDPLLSCTTRGYGAEDRCGSCAAGWHSTCEHAGEEGPLQIGDGSLAPGIMIGYHRDLPGAWGEFMVAHESQVFLVDDGLDDRVAVLIEPLSIAVHAVLNTRVPEDGPVLVVGSGVIAFGTLWALRSAGYRGPLISQVKRPHEAELARALGASHVVKPGDEARQALVDTGAMAYQPVIGPEVYAGGGFPLIFDCVGNRSSLTQVLSYATPRARIVVLGCSAEIPKLDLTFLWSRELDIKGFVGYGTEKLGDQTAHTYELTHELLLSTAAPIGRIVTHVFPLSQYKDALSAAYNHRRSKAVKVLLQPDG